MMTIIIDDHGVYFHFFKDLVVRELKKVSIEWSWLDRNGIHCKGSHQLDAIKRSPNGSPSTTLVDNEVSKFVFNGNDGKWSPPKAVGKTQNFLKLLLFGDAIVGESETEVLIEWTRLKNRLFKKHWKNLFSTLLEVARNEWAIIVRELNYLNFVY